MEEGDLSAWMGKPPEKSLLVSRDTDDNGASASHQTTREQSLSVSDSSSNVEEVNYDGTPA